MKKAIVAMLVLAMSASVITVAPASVQAAPGPSLEETIIYDDNDVTVTVLDIDEDEFGDIVLDITVENNSDTDLYLRTDTLCVNDFYMSWNGFGFLFDDDDNTLDELLVEAGDSVDAFLLVYDVYYEVVPFDEIATIDFTLEFYDADEYDADAYYESLPIFTSDRIYLETSDADGYEPIDLAVGDLLYNKKDLVVMSTGFVEDDYYDLAAVLYIENNSSRGIGLYADTGSINGQELPEYTDDDKLNLLFSGYIRPGARFYDTTVVTDFSSIVESMDDVEEFSVTLIAYDLETGKQIARLKDLTITNAQ